MARDVVAEREEVDATVEGETLCSVFARTVAQLGDADALVARDATGAWRAISWNDYRARVRDVTLGLRSIGFSPGDFAVILCRNRPEHVIADLGVVHAGGTPVSLYNTLAPEQIAYIAGHCEARVAFVEDLGFYEKLQKVRAELPHLEHVVLLSGEADAMSWDELLAAGAGSDDAEFDASWRAVEPDDTLTLVYTSGTTGPPKGVIDTHRSVLWDLESYRRFYATGPGDRVISYLPLAHAADRLLSYWQGVVAGHTTYYCPDINEILSVLVDVRPTFFGAVPRVWEKMHAGILASVAREPDAARKQAIEAALATGREAVAHEQRDGSVPGDVAERVRAFEPVFAGIRAKLGLDEVQMTVTGAAPTPPEVMEFFHAIGIRICEVWGMSELAAIATMNPAERPAIGSIGVALPGVEARIAGDGELLVRGGMTMRGYYKDATKTAETLSDDDWLATGDVATIDDAGYLRIVDRKKELIITAGGKNISPANLESLLKQHPLVGQACVIGDNRAYLTALIVLDGEVAPAWAKQHGIETSSVAGLAQHPAVAEEIARAVSSVNERVARVESIRKHVILPAEWTAESEELTPTLKLKRRVITDKYADAIEAMY